MRWRRQRETSLRNLVGKGKFKMIFKEKKKPAMLREGREAFPAKEAAGPKASRWEEVWHVPGT